MKLLEKSILEKLADLEHEQWMAWAKNILNSEWITTERRARWNQNFVHYTALSNESKELDRFWARKVINQLKKEGVEFIGY